MIEIRVSRGKPDAPTPIEQGILDEQPEVDDAMRLCIQAWQDLGTERPIGIAGAGVIPFRATLAWAQYHRLDRDATEILMTVINRLDCDRAQREASKASNR